MKINPINTNYTINRSFYSKEKENKFSNNTISKNCILDYLNCLSQYNISFSGSKTPLYAIDEDGNYRRFSSRKEASDELETNGSSITQCLNGQRSKAAGYYFLLAKDIESIDKNGNISVDERKLNKKIEEIKSKSKKDNCCKAVYAIERNGDYKKFASISQAASKIGASDSNISKCLNGGQNITYGYGFILAEDIESTDANGNIVIDEFKLEEKRKAVDKAISEQYVAKPFYAVDQYGNYTRFERNSDASKTLNIFHSSIKKCLDKERDTAGGYAFLYAEEVESIDENGNVIITINIPKEKFGQRTPVPVYSINEKGQYRKFPSMGDASSSLAIPRRNIDACLKSERETALGYAFIRADEVEIKDKTGKTSIDYRKLNKKFQQVIKNAVYVVDRRGNFQRYNNGKEAAEALCVTEPTVIFCANGLLRGVKGRTIVKATYIESFDKGKIVYNSELLKKFAAEAGKLSDRPIVAIGEDKKKRKYKNKASAAKSLNIRSDKISRCLKGEQKTTGGFRFVYADTLEKRKRRSSTIYAMKGINEVKEYKDIDEASEMLGLEKDEIIFFLKKGRTKDKQTNLNGYVFATGNDD